MMENICNDLKRINYVLGDISSSLKDRFNDKGLKFCLDSVYHIQITV